MSNDSRSSSNNGGNSEGKESEESTRNFIFVFPKFEFKFPPIFKIGLKGDSDGEEEQESEGPPPRMVKLADPKPVTPPPLKVEDEAGLTSPLIVYPVYALGGFIILKWIWARWNERKERAKRASPPDNDNNQSSDEYQSPTNEEE